MSAVQSSLWNRPDTLLGVCEGLGQDFGFNPLFLRIALAASILWSPAIAVGTYVALGLLVAASRLLFPNKVHRASEPVATLSEARRPANGDVAETLQLAEAA